MKLLPTVLVVTLVAAAITYHQVQYPGEPSCATGGGASVVMAGVQSTGSVLHTLSTEQADTEQIAADTRGMLGVIDVWIQSGLAELRGQAPPPAVSQFEARAVSVQQAAVLACSCGGTGGQSGVQPAGMVEDALAGGGTGSVSGYDATQLANAKAIMDAGAGMGLGTRDQTIGVMTAMGESSLQVLDRGDSAGPDSRGLFQQRDNGAWGTYEQRMDPTESARSFFSALTRVEQRDSMEPTAVAHRVQRNADPNHYAKYWPDAVAIVAAAGGGVASAGVVQAAVCVPGAAGGPVQASAAGSATAGSTAPGSFVVPVQGRMSSAFGNRVHPITGQYKMHRGMDTAAACGTPVVAGQAGTVKSASSHDSYGNIIVVDHGGGVETAYAHLEGFDVTSGTVAQGQQIGRVGTTGSSTGCHLHYEVRVGGTAVNPAPYRPGAAA